MANGRREMRSQKSENESEIKNESKRLSALDAIAVNYGGQGESEASVAVLSQTSFDPGWRPSPCVSSTSERATSHLGSQLFDEMLNEIAEASRYKSEAKHGTASAAKKVAPFPYKEPALSQLSLTSQDIRDINGAGTARRPASKNKEQSGGQAKRTL